MKHSGKWRRFMPRRRGLINDQTSYEQGTIYSQARQIVSNSLHATRSIDERDHSAIARTSRAAVFLRQTEKSDVVHSLALLLLQTPAAVRAQQEMDSHRGGYRNREARLFELIDFNDTFVDTVLLLDASDLDNFAERLRQEQAFFCSSLGVANFSEEQFEAITHGLSREIAVFRGAKKEGYIVRMTSRVQDARGIDMVITDPKSKKSINVDVKTRSAFHFRVLDLERRNRMREEERMRCEIAGFCTISNNHKRSAQDTVLLQISTSRLGEIVNFSFKDTKALAKLIELAIENEGKYIV